MSKASALFSEDSDSIAFYPATQAGVKVLMVANDIDRTTDKPFQIVFGIHKHKRIGSLCLNKHIDITALMVFTTGHGAKKPKRLDAIITSKCTATALQEVYVISLTHTPFLFLVANLWDFSDKTK